MINKFDKSDTTLRYNASLANAKRLEQEALYILEEALKERGIRVDNIEHRVKSLESCLRKCESNARSLEDVDDLVGLRVIALLRSDLDRIQDILQDNFKVTDVENKIHHSADTFGYMSVHCECQLKEGYSGRRYDGSQELKFEIQLRTICMHAWAAVSHHLDYKQELDIPVELRKELNALSGLFYVADSQFESAYAARAASKAAASLQASTSEIYEQRLNLDTLTAYLGKRFSDRDPPTANDVSNLLRELAAQGIFEVRALDAFINAKEARALDYERRNPPSNVDVDDDGNEIEVGEDDGRFTATGFVRIMQRWLRD